MERNILKNVFGRIEMSEEVKEKIWEKLEQEENSGESREIVEEYKHVYDKVYASDELKERGLSMRE